MNKIEEAITEHWGERCPDHEPECPTCQAWTEYDKLMERAVKIRAEEIDNLRPGSVVRLPHLDAPYNTYEWVRMQDARGMHFTGGLFCPTTGEWMAWMGLCYMDQEVELVKGGQA